MAEYHCTKEMEFEHVFNPALHTSVLQLHTSVYSIMDRFYRQYKECNFTNLLVYLNLPFL